MSYCNGPFKINDLVEIKVVTGRLAGRWIPARVIRIHKQLQKLDLVIPNNMVYKVIKFAVQVPFKSVRRPKYRFKEGESIFTKILQGKRQGVWIPARILRVNEDGTYDLFVEEYKKLQVTRYALNVPGEYLKPAKISHNPLKPSILLPTTVREFEFKESLKAKQKWEQRRMQERRPENTVKEKLADHRKKDPNNKVGECKSLTGGSGKQSEEDLTPSGMNEDKKSSGLLSHQSDRSSYKKISTGGKDIKMTSSLVSSSPNTPNHNTSAPCEKSTGALQSLENESSTSAIPSQMDKEMFDSKDAQRALILKPKGTSKEGCHKQGEEKHAADDDGSSTYSVWDHMYESENSESEERQENSESVVSIEDDWGLGQLHIKEPVESTPSVHQLDNSNVTSSGQSPQSWKLGDLYHTQSTPLRVPSKQSYEKNDQMDSKRPSYDFVDSFLESGRKPRSSSAPDRIVTIGVSKHRVQFSEYDFDTPVGNIASWLAEGALKCGKVKSSSLVNNIAFNGKMIPIRNNSSGNLGDLDCLQHDNEYRDYSLRDVLGKSLDASRQGLAFFVGPVNGQMSYKMSVLDVDKIHQARAESVCSEIKEDEEPVTTANLADIGYSDEV